MIEGDPRVRKENPRRSLFHGLGGAAGSRACGPGTVGRVYLEVAERLKERATYPLDSAIDVAWYISVLCIGFFLALLVHRIFPGSATAGRWIWAMPTLLFVLAFASVAVGHGPAYALSDFIDPGPSGEAWWLVVTVTYPTCSCVLYSIGMIFASNRAGRGMTPDSSSAV